MGRPAIILATFYEVQWNGPLYEHSASECWMSRNWDPRCWPEGSTTWPEDYRLRGRWPCGSTSTSDPGPSGRESVRALDITDHPQRPRAELHRCKLWHSQVESAN